MKRFNLRALINDLGYVSLSEDSEGFLRGGFAQLPPGGNNCSCLQLSNNCRCGLNNCSCPPIVPNDCACNGDNCTCYQTVAPPVEIPTQLPTPVSTATPQPNDSTNVLGLGFEWPGML